MEEREDWGTPTHMPPPKGLPYKAPLRTTSPGGGGFGIPVQGSYLVKEFKFCSETRIQDYEDVVTSTWVVCRPPPARCNVERREALDSAPTLRVRRRVRRESYQAAAIRDGASAAAS